MAQYKPSKDAEETEEVFRRLERWLGVDEFSPAIGTAIPAEDPSPGVWGGKPSTTFEVPEDPLDLDDLEAMFPTTIRNQARTRASDPLPSEPKQRSQSRQESI